MNKIRTMALLAALTIVFPSVALAHNCPAYIAEIDEILASKPDLDEETIVDEDNAKNVRQLRDEGEQLHNAGKHDESVKVLEKALELLRNEV